MIKNTNVQKCQFCGAGFVTGNPGKRFCSERCNAAYYYQVRKVVPAYLSAAEENVSLKTHLSVSQTADILGVSVPTVYRYIKKRKLFANKIGCRETLISRKSIEAFQENLDSERILASQETYTINEIIDLAGVGATTAYGLVKKHSVRKIRFKKYVGYLREDIDKVLESRRCVRKTWINFKQVCELLGCDDKYQVMFFLVNYRIPRRKRANVPYFLKEEILERNLEAHRHFTIEP